MELRTYEVRLIGGSKLYFAVTYLNEILDNITVNQYKQTHSVRLMRKIDGKVVYSRNLLSFVGK